MKTKGLTLIEAIKSGRKFRRSSDKPYYGFEEYTLFKKEDVLAEDFELEPEAPRTEKLYKYIYYYADNKRFMEPTIYFSGDEDFLSTFFKCKPVWFQRIEESGREFPVLGEEK